MATGSRTLWKGAITFGLIHIPVGLHTASTDQGVDFDWLDRRTMDPVGYKRINKKTGKEIDKDDIVKGVAYEDGKYVVISAEEIEEVYPRTTQTIELQCFIDANEIPFVYLERPYYVAPINKGQKVYALLREVLIKTGKVGLAKVVLATKQHLAVLVPSGPALVLNLLRWGDEVKTLEGLDLPAAGTQGAHVTPAEMKMAEQLVKDMAGTWQPDEFKNEFKQAVMKIIDKKVKAGDTETVLQPEEEAPSGGGAEVIDLTELLARSLKGASTPRTRAADARKAGPKSSSRSSGVARKAPAKSASKRAAAKKAGASGDLRKAA
ncbi:non-homologous end joining protein Ku [Variovorax ginsengisoli]|uniref:Non-homologous end joining protein Ku n=1 Tax=Variovorax ginsengisoli TaxID=363844 RepID=A0ABT9SAA7_9BURK|nr:Ku protein [Variovorax ginsengisoli]MDP9900829.1 DNA end-binding protein Ku [Variovorax ginsengisoli]